MTFEDDLLALERRVLSDAGGDFFAAVVQLKQMLASQSVGLVSKLVSLAIPQLEAAGKAGVESAYGLGGDWALGLAEVLPTVAGPGDNALGDARQRLTQGLPAHLTDPLTGLDALLREAKTKAVVLHQSGATIEEALSPIFGAATTAQARIETQINAASNTASLTVGDAVGSAMVWEAERDACVYCLALAGEVVETAGDLFPPPDKYADGATSKLTLASPPLHSHCRCRLAVLSEDAREGRGSYPAALQREAQRSILRGFALKSESQKVRLRAAERLLARDPVAPVSVQRYAYNAVKAGRFPTTKVPDGDPRLVATRKLPKTS